MHTTFLPENSEETIWGVILRQILKKRGVWVWNSFILLRIGSSEHGNEPSGSIRKQDFLTS